ncbi:MAG: NHLP leader peptide family RiPP precursor [Spirosomataceae bacterium]
MNLLELQKKSEANLQKIYAKAWEDEAFKQSLIHDPVATLNRIATGGFNFNGVKIQVNDQTDTSTLYLNIPPNPKDLAMDFDMELTEEDMELIAGGVHIKIKGKFSIGQTDFDVDIDFTF